MATIFDGSAMTNSMLNSTESPPWEFNDYAQRAVVASVILITSVVGTIGNSLVILAVLLSKKLRTITNAFVVNLSIADLLTSLVIPWQAVALLSSDMMPLGDWACKIAVVVQATAIGCSTCMLASIGLNRLLLMKRRVTTYRAVFTPRNIAVWLAFTWTIPLLVTILPPLLDVGAIGYNPTHHQCGFPAHPRSKGYEYIWIGTLYPAPLITIIVCYVLIWRHLYRRTKRPFGSSSGISDSTANGISATSQSEVNITNLQPQSAAGAGTASQSQVSRHQFEITKNMFYVVCAFLVCLTPNSICRPIDGCEPALPYAVAIIFINSCINPLIYATKHRNFKIVFRFIVSRQWDRIPEPSDFLKALRGQK